MVILWQSVKRANVVLVPFCFLLCTLFEDFPYFIFLPLLVPIQLRSHLVALTCAASTRMLLPCGSLPFVCSSLLRDPWSNLSSGEGVRPCLLELCRAIWQCLHPKQGVVTYQASSQDLCVPNGASFPALDELGWVLSLWNQAMRPFNSNSAVLPPWRCWLLLQSFSEVFPPIHF